MSGTEQPQLNALGRRIWAALLDKYPDWERHLRSREDGELEVAVPGPSGSLAGHLVVYTSDGHIWLRFAPPSMCYSADDESELIRLLADLLAGRIAFVTTWRKGEWIGTTLLRAGKEPELEPGETAHVVSWSGRLNRVVESQV